MKKYELCFSGLFLDRVIGGTRDGEGSESQYQGTHAILLTLVPH